MTKHSSAILGVLVLVSAAALAGCPPTPPPIQGNCSFSVTPTGTPMVATGGNVKVIVTTANGCRWAFQGNDPWITVEADADGAPNGNGNGAVVLKVAANTGARRVGTATVAFQTITVDQAGTGGSTCTFQVCPVELPFTGGAAGSGAFAIIPSAENCGWTASRVSILEDTVDLTGGGSGGREDRFGVGSATIRYQVKANSQTSPWPAGGGNIIVRDSAQQQAATHLVRLTP
jgi:hypothetical protein